MSTANLEISDDEDAPFIGNGTKKDKRQNPSSAKHLQRKRIFLAALALVVSAYLLFGVSVGPSSASSQSPSSHNHLPTRASSDVLPDDLGDIKKMIQKFQEKRQQFIEKLEVDYGKNHYHEIFEQTINGTVYNQARLAFRPADEGGPSWDRMKRKMMMKLLEVQLAFQRRSRRRLGEDSKASAEVDALLEDKSHLPSRLPEKDGYIPFIWATGGHSSSAGHGNLYNESYTAVMQRGAVDVFDAVGIEFIARNYAMGGTGSGPQLGFCVDEIFGKDIDVLSWDFGMTDGGNYQRMEMYYLRAGMNPNRPVAVAMHTGGKHSAGRINALKDMELRGLAAFNLDQDIFQSMTEKFPDAADGLNEAQIAALPKFVRYFKCGTQMEKGEPGCGYDKYSHDVPECDKRKFQTGWHPGWKWHALAGNLMALFLTEILEDALLAIAESTLSAGDLFTQLKAEEDEDYKLFKASELSALVLEKFPFPDDIDPKVITMGPNMCHSALLPSESRFLGVLTESTKTGFSSFDTGIEEKQAKANFTKDTGPMRLVYSEGQRQKCPIPLNQDHKDWFYVHHGEGWKSLTVPNDAELKMYGTGEPLQGILAVCFMTCDWGRCPAGNIRGAEFHLGMAQIEVNQEPVVNLTQATGCDFLKNKNGHHWKPNQDGRFEIRARAMDPGTFLRFAAFVAW